MLAIADLLQWADQQRLAQSEWKTLLAYQLTASSNPYSALQQNW
jgi:hypothetical protein